MHGSDYLLASNVYAHVGDLSFWRRWLIGRRGRRIFGESCWEVAELFPADDSSLGSIAAPLLQDQMHRAVPGDESPQTLGLLHRALKQPPGSKVQDDVLKQLQRLAAGW